MRKLARFIGRFDLSVKADRLLGMGLLLFVLTGGLVLYSRVAPQTAGLLWMVPSILLLVAFVRYANLVNAVRRALRPDSTFAAPRHG